jgi:hypothetical protein
MKWECVSSRYLVCGGLAAVFALVGGCGASVDAAAKSDVDRQVAAIKNRDQVYQAPTSDEPKPLAVGQWARYRTRDEDGKPGIVTYKIVGEEQGALWYEAEQQSYHGEQVTLILVKIGDRTDPASFDVLNFKVKSDGRVQEYPPELVGMMKALWKPVLDNLVIRWQGLPQEDATVPAGRFTSCYRRKSTVSFAGMSRTSDTWAHPDVPLSGAVKSVGVDKPFSMELIAFGETGAHSALR